MNKKGISPLIATVIIIGFTIVLAALVINYGSKALENGRLNSEILSCAKNNGIWYSLRDTCFTPEELEKEVCPQDIKKTFVPDPQYNLSSKFELKMPEQPKDYKFEIYQKGIDLSNGICYIATKITNLDNIQHRYRIINYIYANNGIYSGEHYILADDEGYHILNEELIDDSEILEFELAPKITTFKRSEFIDCPNNYKDLLSSEVEVVR